jgi:hypothetical protein
LNPAQDFGESGWIAPAFGWRTYSITSSAIARSGGGIFRPSALAVRKFKTNWTFVDCVTDAAEKSVPALLPLLNLAAIACQHSCF